MQQKKDNQTPLTIEHLNPSVAKRHFESPLNPATSWMLDSIMPNIRIINSTSTGAAESKMTDAVGFKINAIWLQSG